ncbi:hypothetical protein SDC9_208054 [bioreactor metagenome]|uniref:Uncharacterized protein n=1 Tax=bioreactor metagenome TaxID=1076179 RepID=A0A645JA74_9ZZZZ
MVLAEQFPRRFKREVRHQPMPDLEVAGVRPHFAVERRVGMGEHMFPEVDAEILFAKLAKKRFRLRKPFRAPEITARIGPRLPARLQSENVAGDVFFAQFPGEGQHLSGVEGSAGAVVAAEAPLRRRRSAAAEQHIAAHRVQQIRPGEEVEVHALRHPAQKRRKPFFYAE